MRSGRTEGFSALHAFQTSTPCRRRSRCSGSATRFGPRSTTRMRIGRVEPTWKRTLLAPWRGSAEAGAGAMLVACRLAGLSALEAYYARARVGAQCRASICSTTRFRQDVGSNTHCPLWISRPMQWRGCPVTAPRARPRILVRGLHSLSGLSAPHFLSGRTASCSGVL